MAEDFVYQSDRVLCIVLLYAGVTFMGGHVPLLEQH
ncbi:MAG: hypothetical protein K0R99_3205 [Microbacterium sp.]|nr:hypothetical protein [Microbacterium sp.]